MLNKRGKEAVEKILYMQNKIEQIINDYNNIQEYEASLKAWLEVFKIETKKPC